MACLTLAVACGPANVTLDPADQAHLDQVVSNVIGESGAATGLLNEYWNRSLVHYTLGRVDYYLPVAVEAYEPDSPPPSACVGNVVNNAYQCPADGKIGYDKNLLRSIYSEVGDAAVMLVLAHEWGHHIQWLADRGPSILDPLRSAAQDDFQADVQDELQADCFAGLFFDDLEDRGLLPAEEYSEIGRQTFLNGDANYQASSWFAANVHGPPSWRVRAVADGILGNYSYCEDYAAWDGEFPIPLGAYAWVSAPGSEIVEQSTGRLVVQSHNATAILEELPGLRNDLTAYEQLGSVVQDWFTGFDVTLNYEPSEVPAATTFGGTVAIQPYELVDSSGNQSHGILLLHVGSTGGGAVVSAFMNGAAQGSPHEGAGWIVYHNLLAVAYGLCPPDGTSVFCVALGEP
jgi:hypothetical protein